MFPTSIDANFYIMHMNHQMTSYTWARRWSDEGVGSYGPPAFSTKWPKSHALFNLRNCFFAWWSLITTRNLVPSMVISKLVLREIFRRKGICHFGDNACDILWNIINFKYTTLQRFSNKGCYLKISLASYNVICPIVKFKPIDSVNLTIMFVKSFIEIEDLVPRNSF